MSASTAAGKKSKAAANSALFVFKGALSKELGITVTVSASATSPTTAKLVVEASSQPSADAVARVVALANMKLAENLAVTFEDLDKAEVRTRRDRARVSSRRVSHLHTTPTCHDTILAQ